MKTMKAMKNAKPMKTTKAMKNAKPMKAMKAMKAITPMAFTRAMKVMIIEICYNDRYENMWWALSAELSEDLLRQFRLIKSGPKFVYFNWEWPQWKEGTAKGLDGKPSNFSSYLLDFDTMTQRNIDTGFERKFRVVQVLVT